MRLWLIGMVLSAASSAARAQSPPPLTRPIHYYNPAWASDGRALAFESTLSGTYSVYSIRPDGTGLTRLTPDSANNEQPAWSPDGRRIVFSSDRAGHLDLYLMNADGSGQTRLTTTTGGGYYGSSFSPDGRWILFQGRPDNDETRERVYLVASDGGGVRQLTDPSYSAEGPRWSPDGRTITFLQVPYPKRLWADMVESDMDAARKSQRLMSILPDGSGLAPVPDGRAGDSPVRWTGDGTRGFFTSSRDGSRAVYEMRRDGSGVTRVADAAVVTEVNPSPDGRHFAYTKSVDGWSGLYLFDRETGAERLLTGGPGAGPVGYLRTATLTARSDTLDTYVSPRAGGAIQRGSGAYVVRDIRRAGGRRWDVSDTWYDSSGSVTARQLVRTARGSLATELESVRATDDSASLLIAADRVTGWVVPRGQAARLFDGPATSERFARAIVVMAIARANPAIGAVYVAPAGSLFGGNPVETVVDTLRVVRRDTLYQGAIAHPVLVLERADGGQAWVDQASGVQLLARGSAGPDRWWWHIRRGLGPPDR